MAGRSVAYCAATAVEVEPRTALPLVSSNSNTTRLCAGSVGIGLVAVMKAVQVVFSLVLIVRVTLADGVDLHRPFDWLVVSHTSAVACVAIRYASYIRTAPVFRRG